MTADDNRKKQGDENVGSKLAAAVVTGAVVGAGVVAGVVAMEDEQNRNKVKKVLSDTKNQVMDNVEDIKKNAEE